MSKRIFAIWTAAVVFLGILVAQAPIGTQPNLGAPGTGANTWFGTQLFSPDNTYDIGANGASRPRNLYVGGTGAFGGAVSISNGATGGNLLTASSSGSSTTTIQVANGNGGVNLSFNSSSAAYLNSLSSPLWIDPANYVPTENGANNAIASGANSGPAIATGLCVRIKLAHTLQAGANTFAYNGGTAKSILSHRNPASNIAVAYAVGGLFAGCYDGTQWQDMSQ